MDFDQSGTGFPHVFPLRLKNVKMQGPEPDEAQGNHINGSVLGGSCHAVMILRVQL